MVISQLTGPLSLLLSFSSFPVEAFLQKANNEL
jgi:hypothetical protein